MAQAETLDTATAAGRADRYLPLLVLLFAASGCSALIYEIVWFQLLQLAIGSTAVSLGVLLATYMGGLCLGSLALPRLKTTLHPLKVYAVLEAGIGILGLVALGLIPLVESYLHSWSRSTGLAGMLLRGLLLYDLPAAAHHPHGRIAARHRALDRIHAARRILVGHALRREHRRAPSSAACWRASTCCASITWPRRLRRRGHQPGGRRRQLLAGRAHPRPLRRHRVRNRPTSPPRLPTIPPAGPSTSPSPFPAPAPWAPKWSGPA